MLVLPGTMAGWEDTHKYTEHMAASSSARIPINSHNRDWLWIIWADPEHVHVCCLHTLTTGSKSTYICNRPMQTNEPFQKRQAVRVQQIISGFYPVRPSNSSVSQCLTEFHWERDFTHQDFSIPEKGWLSLGFRRMRMLREVPSSHASNWISNIALIMVKFARIEIFLLQLYKRA